MSSVEVLFIFVLEQGQGQTQEKKPDEDLCKCRTSFVKPKNSLFVLSTSTLSRSIFSWNLFSTLNFATGPRRVLTSLVDARSVCCVSSGTAARLVLFSLLSAMFVFLCSVLFYNREYSEMPIKVRYVEKKKHASRGKGLERPRKITKTWANRFQCHHYEELGTKTRATSFVYFSTKTNNIQRSAFNYNATSFRLFELWSTCVDRRVLIVWELSLISRRCQGQIEWRKARSSCRKNVPLAQKSRKLTEWHK